MIQPNPRTIKLESHGRARHPQHCLNLSRWFLFTGRFVPKHAEASGEWLINWLLYTIIRRSLFYWLILQRLSRNTFSSKLFRLLNWNWMWMSNLCEARMLPTLPMGVLGLSQCCRTGTRWVPTDEGMSRDSWFSYCLFIFLCLQLKLNLTETRESQSEPGFFSNSVPLAILFIFQMVHLTQTKCD